MHVRQLLIISSLILVGNVALGADLDRDDVPSDCHSACDPLVSISQRCDRQTDNDAAEARCICRANNASSIIPRCEACIAQYRLDNPSDNDNGDDDNIDDSGPHDNDAYDILTACNLSTTSYTPSSTSHRARRQPSTSSAHRSSSTHHPPSSSSHTGKPHSTSSVRHSSSAHHSPSSSSHTGKPHSTSSVHHSSSSHRSSTSAHSPTRSPRYGQ
ncbi:hypothetical protein BDW67DRAFT_124502 [Aspergillus spinulosporus]